MEFSLKTLVGRLNATCRQCLEDAAGLCVSQGNYHVELEHLFLKLAQRPDTDLHRILGHYGVEASTLTRQLVTAIEGFKRGNTRVPTLSPHLPRLFRESWLISTLLLGGRNIRSGTLLLALRGDPVMNDQMTSSVPSLARIDGESLRRDLEALLRSSPEDDGGAAEITPFEAPVQLGESPAPPSPPPMGEESAAPSGDPSAPIEAPTPYLDQYTVNLTQRAREGHIDPIIGRDSEIRQAIDILTRRRQNNPILTGAAGVGKTAVVEGLAQRIADADVPPSLAKVSLRLLDLALLQAGASMRGEFERRLKHVIEEIQASLTPIVVFIDEAHTLIGAGGAAGQGDAANLLKPALARGELRTIAATTWAEYKRFFEKDAALARRFQVIKVDEPEPDTAVAMLRGLAPHLETHHGVRILDGAICDAVHLSKRYIPSRQLPDKAISVLDTACARVGIGLTGTPPRVEDARRHVARLEQEIAILEREQTSGGAHAERLSALQDELDETHRQLERAEEQWSAETEIVARIHGIEAELESPGKEVKARDLDALRIDLDHNKTMLADLQGSEPMVPLHVDGRVVAAVVSGWTGIPIGKMLTDEVTAVLELAERLGRRVVGQDEALEAIARRIRTSRANLEDPSKPIGVFLLVGPSGIGKTETALALADQLYGGERNLITINMSEYQEAHTVSGLKGSPPGYVGYGTGGVLTEAVRRNPYSVVLLDEVEKAHTDVMELFYQVFDKGTLEDGEGVPVDFRHTVILLTSNLGTDPIRLLSLGDERSPVETVVEAIRPTLLTRFKPAFLGRLAVVPYYPLREPEIRRIIELKLGHVRARYQENHLAALTHDPAVVDTIADRCTEVDSGARNVDAILTHTLLPGLAGAVLDRMAQDEPAAELHVGVGDDGNFTFGAPPAPSESDPEVVDPKAGEAIAAAEVWADTTTASADNVAAPLAESEPEPEPEVPVVPVSAPITARDTELELEAPVVCPPTEPVDSLGALVRIEDDDLRIEPAGFRGWLARLWRAMFRPKSPDAPHPET